MSQWDIFVSYSRQDAEIVQRYADFLRHAGLEVWFDVAERPGGPASLPIFMTHGILESRLLCLFVSDHSMASAWVQQEFSTFTRKVWGLWNDQIQPTVLVLLLPGVDPSLTESLGGHSWRPFRERPVEVGVCQLHDTDACRQELVENLKKLVATIRSENQPPEESNENRLRLAERYWEWTRPKTLSHWETTELPWILSQFDHLTPPFAGWPGIDPQRFFDVCQFLPEVLHTDATGLTFSCLFAEAIAAGIGSRYSSINDRVDEELSAIHGQPAQLTVLSTGSPVDLLCSVGIDLNFSTQLQDAYYTARATRNDQFTIDALDLSVLLSLGFILHRWENLTISPKSIVQALVAERPVSDYF